MTIARHVGEKIVERIKKAPAGGIFHDAEVGDVFVQAGHIGSTSPVQFRLQLDDGGIFDVKVEYVGSHKNTGRKLS